MTACGVFARCGQHLCEEWTAPLQQPSLSPEGVVGQPAVVGSAGVGAPSPKLSALNLHFQTLKPPQETKPVGEFYRSRASTDGWDGRCKECDRAINREKHRAKPRLATPTVEEKARPRDWLSRQMRH